ncbi:MAG TPA: VOC family protein [Thermoplasmata archaeon]|nr:VOC family protein [Thermoplasmata archaeon]
MLEYTGIRVRDLVRSRRFYSEGLGLRLVESARVAAGGTREILEDPATGARLELNFYPDQPPYAEGSELDHLAFLVEALESSVERLTALGGRTRMPAFTEGGRRIAFVADPDGIWVKLSERAESDLPPTSRSME